MSVTRMYFARAVVALGAAFAIAGAQQEKGTVNKYGNPMKIAPRPTSAEITEKDLRTRLYQFADDSMMGRATGTIGNKKGTDYLAAELKRLGLEPAGDNGTYFQEMPYGMRYYAATSTLGAGGQQLRWGTEFTAGGAVAPSEFANVQIIFGGIAGDTTKQIAPGLAVGRFVILLPDPNAAAGRGGRGAGGGGGGGGGRGGRGGFPGGGNARFAGAVAIATADLDGLTPQQLTALTAKPTRSTLQQQNQAPAIVPGAMLGQPAAAPTFRLTRAAAEKLMGVSLATAQPGAAGHRATGKLVVTEEMTPTFGRNVVAIIRGSDPTLKEEFVAIGAHNDHDPITLTGASDHDSVKAYNDALYALRMADGKQVLAANQEMQAAARAKVNMAELRAKNGAGRLDSIRNGADDDGSGSMAMLEIAEAVMAAKVKPKRSFLFVWHTGEETGLQGSRWYTDHPTVPIEKIVAQINMDMIGRGRTDDIPGGGADYLAVVGSKRLSDDLANMVVSSNKGQKKPFKLDYQFDDSVTWAGYNNIYGRSDHANYARKGIPIAFFFTGLHGDYHQLTDEPQYIDYPHYSRIVNYIRDLVVNVGNGPRPKVRQVAQ